jgi:hypothetical protein
MTLLIDGSHSRVSEFNVAVIDYAVRHHALKLDAEARNAFLVSQRDGRRLVSDLTPGECEYLNEIADEAVEFMNDHVIDGTYYVEDSGLWFEMDDDVAREAQAAYDDRWL